MELMMLAKAGLEAIRRWEESNEKVVEKKCSEHSDRVPDRRSGRMGTYQIGEGVARAEATAR